MASVELFNQQTFRFWQNNVMKPFLASVFSFSPYRNAKIYGTAYSLFQKLYLISNMKLWQIFLQNENFIFFLISKFNNNQIHITEVYLIT